MAVAAPYKPKTEGQFFVHSYIQRALFGCLDDANLHSQTCPEFFFVDSEITNCWLSSYVSTF